MSKRRRICQNDIKELAEKFLKHCKDISPCCKSKVHFSKEDACRVAAALGVNVNNPCFNIDQFWKGLNVELEHGLIDPNTNVTNNDPILTGKIALAHLNEYPDYYTRLARMEKEAKEYWSKIIR